MIFTKLMRVFPLKPVPLITILGVWALMIIPMGAWAWKTAIEAGGWVNEIFVIAVFGVGPVIGSLFFYISEKS